MRLIFITISLLAVVLVPHAAPVGAQQLDTLKTPSPRPTGGDIVVTTRPSGAASDVTLVYVINYGSEVALSMTPSDADGSLTATIPSTEAVPGSLARWYVRATVNGARVRDPPFETANDQQYYGTIVEDVGDSHSLPVIELYCKDPRAPYNTDSNAAPSCSMWFRDKFYDNIIVRRRGESSLNWPKPKMKVDSGDQGKIFDIEDGADTLKEFNLGSEWYEPGENTFMRETLAWKTFKAMGVDSLISYQTVVRLNGKYYGKFALGEDWDSDQLQAAGYSDDPAGFLFKSLDGEKSNLRWDLPVDQIQYYYRLSTQRSQQDRAAQELVDFTKGLAGGAGMPRSKFVFDAINLPKTINHMAAQTVLLNQDRCTKNFYVYYEPSSDQWSFLPWDLESTFSIDRGLGGAPNLQDYCTLACPQWNSPLYCDRNHQQDLLVGTPWTLITTTINPSTLAASGRKLLLNNAKDSNTTSCASDSSSGSSGNDPVAGASRTLKQLGSLRPFQTSSDSNTPSASQDTSSPNTTTTTNSDSTSSGSMNRTNPGLTAADWAALPQDYDLDLTQRGPTPLGAPGTFNYLIDAILSVPRTRAMYLRRVRSLMDEFIASGRLQGLVTGEHELIRGEAARDVVQWGNPGDPERGYRQLITEQLPIRRDQLYNTYGPNGQTPLIPEGQDSSVSISIGTVLPGADGYIQVLNPNAFSIDVSGWSLSGDSISFTFVPGTVIPANDAVYVAAGSIAGFKSRMGGQGLFVVGPMSGSPSGSGDISISKA